MSLKNISLLLVSFIATNNIYAINYYMNNIGDSQNNNQFMQDNYLNTQNETIHKRITEKLEHARQQLNANPEDDALSNYIKTLEDLQKIQNISQEANMDTLINLHLVDINNNNNGIQNNEAHNNNIAPLNNIANNNPLIIEPIQVDLNVLNNNIDNETQFIQLLNITKNIVNTENKKKAIKKICDYIFIDNWSKLDDIFTLSENEDLNTMLSILTMDECSSYMGTEYMDIKAKLENVIWNTFIEQCQMGYYGEIENQESFNKVFDAFFEQTKQNQFIKKFNEIKDHINIIDAFSYGESKISIITQIKEQLIKHIEIVKAHIDNAFDSIKERRTECYSKACNESAQSHELNESLVLRDTNYTLSQLMKPIYDSNNKYYDLNSSFNKLQNYLFADDYNYTYFQIKIQEDISSLKFKLKKEIELNETEKTFQKILNNAQDNKLNIDNYDFLFNKYTTQIDDNLKKEYDNAYNHYFSFSTNFVNTFWSDIDNIVKFNALNTIEDQLKLDISEKLKKQTYFVNKVDTYILTNKLYPNIK